MKTDADSKHNYLWHLHKIFYTLFSNPDDFNFSDFIADFGVQWIPELSLVDYYEEVGFSHEQAGKMYFDTQLDNAQTPHEMLCSSIKEYLETK